MRLRYDHGTVRIEGSQETLDEVAFPFVLDGESVGALQYGALRDSLRAAGVEFDDEVLDPVSGPRLSCSLSLRPYQSEALRRWRSDERGVVVLPTGAGKTYVGMAAIDTVGGPTLVVVPTLDLVDQWRDELARFEVPVGEFSGRTKDLSSITVATYDSAYTHATTLGNRFEFVLFDEVHHLAAESYRRIAERMAAPARMGLTATYERDDGAHERLVHLLGGKVYEIGTDDLTGEYLSTYTVERITVELTSEEREAYDEHAAVFRNYVAFSNVSLDGPDGYRNLVVRSGNDPRAWRAIRAKETSRKIAFNAESKLDELASLLRECRENDDRIIVFTRYNDLVHVVADRFLIPSITYKTPTDERRSTLSGFKAGRYDAIVSSQVLDEGVDVPDANVGIILSGTGSEREYRQRLGRILRPSEKPARLYELVSADTGETRTADRRRA
ncbi:helicase [Haloprofundus marisrubri]|uniref:Helicase n=1 Tax=Haloprofundus marisrubri TaxID=1514971 RepID=A0A0W1R524_9EURY|nr:DEAD/DEAH box helicase family protein [Haloprofundus marisrubri]KTG08483.1 helicase [Haloprofundus marisrubri]